MKRSRLQIFLVAGLLALLGVLAVLQYVWLGQISDGEKERMSRRLQTDTERFGEDFNREIQSAYLNFQIDESLWQQNDWTQFNERYDFWRKKAAYQNLITDFYYLENKPGGAARRYDAERREFAPVQWTDELREIKTSAGDPKTFQSVDERHFALVMTIFETERSFKRILISERKRAPEPRERPALAIPALTTAARLEFPARHGFLVIKLDDQTVRNGILPDLAKKHFPEGDFNLAVTNRNGERIFQTGHVSAPDSSAGLFVLSSDNLIFFSNREVLPRLPVSESKTVVDQMIQTHTYSSVESETGSTAEGAPERKSVETFQLRLREGERPRTRMKTPEAAETANWTLNVQHVAGSVDKYISGTRFRNLGISFGILGLLAVSIVLIFISAYRARVFAQRQVDFVSSVSHEFRTPLAVIYSAGENLADGVAREQRQVSRYGNLIKNEGKKLSAMVEQILEFAGAGAGKKKYDFREHRVETILEKALDESRPLLEEQGFTIETDFDDDLPAVRADANALGQALQNLIGNSLKYSKPFEKWLGISASRERGKVIISVEDRGIGIAPPDLKKIFEPFYRARAVVDEQIHGNGLGLSLVRETVAAHGGKITAESALGKGSRFIIELPGKKNQPAG